MGEVTYKIRYTLFKEYFGIEDVRDVQLYLYINKVFSKIRKISKIYLWMLFVIFFIIVYFIVQTMAQIISLLLTKLIGLIISKNIPFTLIIQTNPESIYSFILPFIIILLVITMLHVNFRNQGPYVLRDLINDPRLIKLNVGKFHRFIDANKFAVLAIAKNEGDLRGYYNWIPGYTETGRTKSGSWSDLRKKMSLTSESNKFKVNGIPLLNKEKYVPWKFEIIDFEGQINEKNKKNIEKMLSLLWDYYLDMEFERISYRKKKDMERYKK